MRQCSRSSIQEELSDEKEYCYAKMLKQLLHLPLTLHTSSNVPIMPDGSAFQEIFTP